MFDNLYNQAIATNKNILANSIDPTITAKTVSAGSYNPSTYAAKSYAASTYGPSLISAPTPYTAAQLSSTDLTPYEDPYTKDVINASLATLNQQRGQQQVADNEAATAANAFGGSRQAVQRALTSQLYDQNAGNLISNLNSQNFMQAQEAALADAAARNAASQFNNTMAFNVGNANAGFLNSANQFNAGAANEAAQFNANAGNAASQFNANAANAASQFNLGQRLSADQFNAGQDLSAQQNSFTNRLGLDQFNLGAANNLASLGDAQLASQIRQAGLVGAVGDAQQQQQQRALTDAYNQYLQNINLESMKQQLPNQALGIIPIQQTTNSDSTTDTHSNPGALGVLGGIASLGLQVAGMPASSVGGTFLTSLLGGGSAGGR